MDMEKMNTEKDVEGLIKALKYEEDYVRMDAAEALGEICDARAVEPLIQALKGDEEKFVRRYAAEALGKIGDARAVEPLIQALKEDEDNDVHLNAAEALIAIGEPAVEPLLQAVKDEDEGVRGAALWALGKTGDARAVEPLIQGLEDGYVQETAEALGKIGDARAVEPLIKVLRDKVGYHDDLAEAIRALGEIGDKRAIEPIVEVRNRYTKGKGSSRDIPDSWDELVWHGDMHAISREALKKINAGAKKS